MVSLQTNVQMLKGVGPQRAELLAQRGIYTLEDLLNYLPFRYEDRIHFSKIKDVQPNGIYTLRARVMSGQAVRGMYGRDAIYHLLVQDDSGSLALQVLPRRLSGRPPEAWSGADPSRQSRNRQAAPRSPGNGQSTRFEVLSGDEIDSTEMGRIVPIYEAVGTFGTRQIRRSIYATLQNLDPSIIDILPASLRNRLGFPARRDALMQTHFPPAAEPLEALNQFRSPAQRRLIFEEFFLYQLSLALGRKATRKESAIPFRVREDKVREALKTNSPFQAHRCAEARPRGNRRRPGTSRPNESPAAGRRG